MAEETHSTGGAPRSATENIREVTQAGKELLAAGERLTSNLSELQEHMEHALDWREQLSRHTLLAIGVGIAVSGLLWRLLKR